MPKAPVVFTLQKNNMADLPSLVSHIRESAPLPGVALLSYRAHVKDIVTLMGSFLGGKNFSKNPMLADLTVAMLEEGTKHRSREAIREALSAMGATIAFTCGGDRVGFRATFLREHAPEVIEILAEQLQKPKCDAKILATVKEREIGSLKLAHDDTRYRAEERLSQILYPKEHPNFETSTKDKISAVAAINQQAVRDFHRSWGRGAFLMAAVGAISHEELAALVEKNFSTWRSSILLPKGTPPANRSDKKIREIITVEDKASVDFMMGAPIGINCLHPDFFALYLGLQVLGGGGFNNRLTQSVRERKGLTYHVRAGLGGMDDCVDGHWYAYGSFAPAILSRGERVMEDEIKKFVSYGVTAAELAMKKESIAGSYIISLSTTGGFAGRILSFAEEGRPLTHINEFPEIIKKLTLTEVNRAIGTYLYPKYAVSVAAGSVK
ncbi:hypothetical protein A2671_02405 [Candidatus Kaiserbacteria bacterium RIFCSPHIGHO2_01_FULL_49_13]|uniref:Peptidase M16 C-terminal domain-containing protein n=1 Tax=Candidatus Kaiserbacteria bacterium RIFCSPHIGHO2_01_FULL_49_13 TaxID=1798477 RepID=A0A1F6CCE0_9BACT|nr:MAG: hypothetical protein A2671_02405 [Candidatus Kaiserbacteria bacterium RIFCSPHIGHO2_01_FULL_49_13]